MKTRDETLTEKLRSIKSMLDYMNMPQTRTDIGDVADSALHILSRPDPMLDRMAMVLAAMVQATYKRDGFNFTGDRQLYDWALEQARELTS